MEVFFLKRTRVLFLTLFFLVSASIGVFAADHIKKVEAYIREDFQIFLNGKKVDVGEILVYENKSYLPLTEVGQLVDSEIKWKESNKGIYINQRYQGQPTQPVADNLTYDNIELYQPEIFNVSYLGDEYNVFANTVYNYETYESTLYYREKDLNLMGINTKGLRKALDSFTDQIYISKDEVAGLWIETPKFTRSYEFKFMGEKDEDRMKKVNSFIESIPITEASLRGEDISHGYFPTVNVFLIDTLPNNEYNILTYHNGIYSWYWVKLKQNMYDHWYIVENTSKSQNPRTY